MLRAVAMDTSMAVSKSTSERVSHGFPTSLDVTTCNCYRLKQVDQESECCCQSNRLIASGADGLVQEHNCHSQSDSSEVLRRKPMRKRFPTAPSEMLRQSAFSPCTSLALAPVEAPSPSGLKARRAMGKEKGALASLRVQIPVKKTVFDAATRLDGYDVLENLGEGSVGLVRRGIRHVDRKQVALKFTGAHDEEHIHIVEQEFEVLRSIDHPNIVKAIEYFKHGDRMVLVIDFFNGSELDLAVKKAPQGHFSEAVAWPLFLKLVDAVGYLHRRRIVHRDIKPQNILVCEDLVDLRLVDFNTAHCYEEGEALTLTGTLLYAAPEVLQGSSLSEATDVWSVGLCFFFMLSGCLPQGREKLTTACIKELRRHSRDACSLPESCCQQVSAACRQTLTQCLAIDPMARPTAAALLADVTSRNETSAVIATSG